MRRKVVTIKVSSNFHTFLEIERRKLQRKIGLKRTITHAQLTEILSKKIKFPPIKTNLFQNGKKKKR